MKVEEEEKGSHSQFLTLVPRHHIFCYLSILQQFVSAYFRRYLKAYYRTVKPPNSPVSLLDDNIH
jgi:hypothetical protein